MWEILFAVVFSESVIKILSMVVLSLPVKKLAIKQVKSSRKNKKEKLLVLIL
jgi:hypothetical protein